MLIWKIKKILNLKFYFDAFSYFVNSSSIEFLKIVYILFYYSNEKY